MYSRPRVKAACNEDIIASVVGVGALDRSFERVRRAKFEFQEERRECDALAKVRVTPQHLTFHFPGFKGTCSLMHTYMVLMEAWEPLGRENGATDAVRLRISGT